MMHSPACEAFRDRRIRRDPETAEPSGSVVVPSENTTSLAAYLSSSARVLPRAEFLALMQMRVVVHFVVLVVVVSLSDYLRLLVDIRLLNTIYDQLYRFDKQHSREREGDAGCSREMDLINNL